MLSCDDYFLSGRNFLSGRFKCHEETNMARTLGRGVMGAQW